MIRSRCRRAQFAAVILCGLSLAAAAQTHPAKPHRRVVHHAARRLHAASVQPAAHLQPVAAPAAPPAPLRPNEMPPRPAAITLHDGRLTIDADNSDLRQILTAVAGKSGMTITGLDTTSRVFGVYGPGAPRDVLTNLLSGSGYNFIMTGNNASGFPGEIVLSTQTGGPFVPTPETGDNNGAGPPPWQQPRAPFPQGGFMPNATPQQRMQQRLDQLRQMRQNFPPQQQQ